MQHDGIGQWKTMSCEYARVMHVRIFQNSFSDACFIHLWPGFAQVFEAAQGSEMGDTFGEQADASMQVC
jgi:hypothetical protein